MYDLKFLIGSNFALIAKTKDIKFTRSKGKASPILYLRGTKQEIALKAKKKLLINT